MACCILGKFPYTLGSIRPEDLSGIKKPPSEGLYTILNFAVELLTYNGEPQSILFIQLDTDSLYQNMAHIFSKNTDSLSMFVYDCFQNPLWENYAPYRADLAENDMLTSQSSWLAWTLYMPISTSTYTSMWYATHAPFVLLLVSALLIISLFVSAFMYRPVYRVSKALDEIDLPISADTMPDTEQNYDLSKSISRINAYQKELDAALQSVSEDVRTKLFLSLVECTPISYSTVEKTLQGIRSKFSVSGLYVSIAFLLENGEEVIDVAFSVAKDYLESYEKIHEFVACMPLKLSNKNEIAVILEFQDVDTAIVTGKKETMTLRNALSDLLNRKGGSCRAENGHLYHSVMDVGFSYKEALDALHSDKERESAEAEKDSLPTNIQMQAHRMIEWIYQGNMSAAESLIEPTADLILNKQHNTAIQAKQVCLDFLLALLNEIGLYEFVDTSSLPDVYTRLSQENFPQSLSEQHDLVLNAVAELINAFHASISRQHNPHIARAREYIQSHLSDRDLSLSSTADALGMSGSYLSRLFSQSLNINYSAYVNQVRIQASLKDLTASADTISVIAERYGFSSSRNYIYAFKKQYQMTPGEYWSKYGT